MRSDRVVVVAVLPQHPMQMSLAENDHVVEALASQGSDHSLAN